MDNQYVLYISRHYISGLHFIPAINLSPPSFTNKILINRRQFLRKTNKLPKHGAETPKFNDVPAATGINNDTGATNKAPFKPGLAQLAC